MTTGVAEKPALRKECFFSVHSEFALLVEALDATHSVRDINFRDIGATQLTPIKLRCEPGWRAQG